MSHDHHGDHKEHAHESRPFSFRTVHAMLLKNTPPSRSGVSEYGTLDSKLSNQQLGYLEYKKAHVKEVVDAAMNPYSSYGSPWFAPVVASSLFASVGWVLGTQAHGTTAGARQEAWTFAKRGALLGVGFEAVRMLTAAAGASALTSLATAGGAVGLSAGLLAARSRAQLLSATAGGALLVSAYSLLTDPRVRDPVALPPRDTKHLPHAPAH